MMSLASHTLTASGENGTSGTVAVLLATDFATVLATLLCRAPAMESSALHYVRRWHPIQNDICVAFWQTNGTLARDMFLNPEEHRCASLLRPSPTLFHFHSKFRDFSSCFFLQVQQNFGMKATSRFSTACS